MPDSTSILAMLAAVAVKATVLLVPGAVAARLLRRSSAASRHLVWTAALGGTLILVLSAPLPPSWSVSLGASIAIPRIAVPVHDASVAATPREAPASSGAAVALSEDPASRRPNFPGLADAMVLLWVGGVVILALRMVAGQLSLRRLVSRGSPIEAGPVRVLLDRVAGSPRAALRIRLIETHALTMPATWGVFRPVIAMPAAAAAWPADGLEDAVRHEFAHVRRLDALTQFGADVCCALLWFHPAVWLAARMMRIERERACDDSVLAAGAPDIGYAEFLLALAAGAPRGAARVRSAIAMADSRELEGRLRAILDPARPRSSPRSLMVTVPAFALIAVVVIAELDVWRAAPVHAVAPPPRSTGAGERPVAEVADDAAPDSAEILLGERIPMTPEQERWALSWRFLPRDERERLAIARIEEAAQHIKQHSMDHVRERAVWALWIADADQVLAPLVAQLSNDDWRARAYAAWNLALVGAPAREALTARLRDPVWRVRAMAASALASLSDPRSTEDMLPLLSDPAWQVRVPAVEFLSRVRTPEAVAGVRAGLNDPHVAVRSAAEEALGEFPAR